MISLFLDPSQRCCLRIGEVGTQTEFIQLRGSEVGIFKAPSDEFAKHYRPTSTVKPLYEVIQHMLELKDSLSISITPGAWARMVEILASLLPPKVQEDAMSCKSTTPAKTADKAAPAKTADKAAPAKTSVIEKIKTLAPKASVETAAAAPKRAPYTPPFPAHATKQPVALPFSTAKVVASPTKASAVKKAEAPTTKSADAPVKRGKKSDLADSSKVTVMATNPHREGTLAYRTFALYASSKTVGDFRAACVKNECDANYIHSHVTKGYIVIE